VALALLVATIAPPPVSGRSFHVPSVRHARQHFSLVGSLALAKPARSVMVTPSVDTGELREERDLPHPHVMPLRAIRVLPPQPARLPVPPVAAGVQPQNLRI